MRRELKVVFSYLNNLSMKAIEEQQQKKENWNNG